MVMRVTNGEKGCSGRSLPNPPCSWCLNASHPCKNETIFLLGGFRCSVGRLRCSAFAPHRKKEVIPLPFQKALQEKLSSQESSIDILNF